MIICVCNNVNVQAIKNAVNDGADTLEKVRETTGAASCCGKCQFKVNRQLQQHLTQSNDAQSVPMTAIYS
ncbi:(2Fe-2S)-binding protein [Methylophaga sp. OBS3]|uniref:(2Fe-2S)-binding protein n=1 Tax=Methylophaga sp. OBS3 TaxID=2991934 RepID=UPI00224DE40C|nr:(2Fe-2S)-binding protein [Methylophaga sp. OBS3]MCX4189430.1 (2Fe-2S)-binding protein [Methylophaga sp. OBS3]